MQEATPEIYDQPLSRWSRVWRVLLALVISGLAWGNIAYHQWNGNQVWFWVDLAGGIVSFVLVRYRRRWPYPVALILTAFGFFSMSSAGPGVWAVVSLCRRRNLRQIVPIALTNVLATQVYALYDPSKDSSPAWVNFAFTLVVTVAVVAFGMYIGSRLELVWTLKQRAIDAEAEQGLRVEQARSAERERIAREMHDVLAHRISLVTMHAGALAYRTDLPPEQVRETAELIQTKAHEALADLRQVLGVLRGTEHGDRPQPTLSDLGELVEEATTSGMTVDFADETGPEAPAEQTGRTVYRIVQEALTNARKHAIGAHVAVRVTGSPDDGVTVSVSNARRVGVQGMPTTPGAGLGLVGLRERAELAGGSLAVVQDSATFTLRGWLPWSPGSQG
ncbi:sensor histidine kinase [Nocardioides marmorisolisilvae]|uniref:histidine kinase n=1 Tax=Nocardioides marmorisolisilvae TaxID=1542737 RepID=A0A3N0DXK4_9ACTN|nr:histidine kinase [Nocardioides marmorisolisilvae]RNL80329.1 histidine kinase [Nocardioides marmorisolisilvae]